MQEIFLKTQDNTKIALNHYSSGRNCVIIICPGWYMCKDSKVFKAISEDFFKNYDVITMDFRGHGRSSGCYTFSAKEPVDLKAVVNYAKTKYTKIGLIGFSLGGATAIIHTAKYKDIDYLIAVSAPCDFYKIENRWFKKEAFIPTIRKFELWRARGVRPGNPLLKKVKPVDVVQNIVPIPVLFLAGEKDPTIYPWHAQELYNKACGIKSINIFQNNYHAEDLYLSSREKFMNCCYEWFSNIKEAGECKRH